MSFFGQFLCEIVFMFVQFFRWDVTKYSFQLRCCLLCARLIFVLFLIIIPLIKQPTEREKTANRKQLNQTFFLCIQKKIFFLIIIKMSKQNQPTSSARHSIFRNPLFMNQHIQSSIKNDTESDSNVVRRGKSMKQCSSLGSQQNSQSHLKHKIFSKELSYNHGRAQYGYLQATITRNASRQKKHKIFSECSLSDNNRTVKPLRSSLNATQSQQPITKIEQINRVDNDHAQLHQKLMLTFGLQKKKQKHQREQKRQDERILTPDQFSQLIYQARTSRKPCISKIRKAVNPHLNSQFLILYAENLNILIFIFHDLLILLVLVFGINIMKGDPRKNKIFKDVERGIQLPLTPKKNSNQKLLGQESLPAQYQPRQAQQVQPAIHYELDYRDPAQRQNNDCFPKFLIDLGACCTPCKIWCSCCCCSCCLCSNNPVFIQEMQSLGLLQEWGRFSKILEPGLHMINPISQSIVQVNQQTQILEYRQICISKDNVGFDAVVVVFYRFVDSLKAAYRLGNVNTEECLEQISTGTLRNIAGENNIQDIIQNRDLVCTELTDHLNFMLGYWGIYVQISSLKNISIDPAIQQVLQTVAVAKRTNQAMIISYQAQVSCAKLYRQLWAKGTTKAAFQIRYLNMLDTIISESRGSIIILRTNIEDQMGKDSERQPLISL